MKKNYTLRFTLFTGLFLATIIYCSMIFSSVIASSGDNIPDLLTKKYESK